jgi:HK97 family phage major capsid protein
MTLEELLEALKALIEEAGEEPMTEEQMERYEDLEVQIATANREKELRSRHQAYLTPQVMKRVQTTEKDDTINRAFEHYLRTGVANHDMVELRAQSEGVDTAGGFLVPPEFRQKLVERMVAFGGVAAHVETISTSTGGPLEFPTLDDTANVGSITAEGAQFAAGADLVFGTLNLSAYKYTSQGTGQDPLRVSVELLQDAAFDVSSLVARKLGERIARKQADDWINGNGVGEPVGLLGSTVTADETVDVADVLDYDDLLDLETRLDPAYEQNARWIMSKATWSVVRGIVDTTGRPLVQELAVSGIGSKPAPSLLGYPVTLDQEALDFGAATGPSNNIALGDFREAYVIRRVANLTIVVNPYTRANFGQTEYVAWERADGAIQNRNAYVVLANL